MMAGVWWVAGSRATRNVVPRAAAALVLWLAAAAIGWSLTLGGFAPLYPTLAVVVAASAVVAVQHPKLMVAAAVLFALFDQVAAQTAHIQALQNLDDASVAAAAVLLPAGRIARGQTLRKLPGLWWFVAYGLLGAFSSQLHHVPLRTAGAGMFLALKGVAFGFAAAQVDWDQRDVRRAAKYAGILFVVVLSCAAMNLLLPQQWMTWTGSGGVDYRYGLPSLVGLSLRPGLFSQVTALMAICALAYRQTVVRSRGAGATFLASLFACLLSLRRTALVGIALAVAAVRARRDRLGTVIAGAGLLVVVLALFWTQLRATADSTYSAYLGGGSRQARTILYRDSMRLAREYFPLGAGFGRFGSHIAIAHYSPEYFRLGYEHVWGLQPASSGVTANGNFGSDTFWPAVLGETGLFGLLAFGGGLLQILRFFRRGMSSDAPWMAFLGLVGVGWWLELLVESISNPPYVAPPTYPLLFGLAGVAWALSKRPLDHGMDVR
jgi:hypothetical protein